MKKIFTLATAMLCSIGMWATKVSVAYTYESSASKATMATNDLFSAASNPTVTENGTFSSTSNSAMLRCTVAKSKEATVTFTFTAKTSIELASFSFNSYTGSDAVKAATVDYYKNSETPVNTSVTFNKNTATDISITVDADSEEAGNQPIEMSEGDVFTIKVNLKNTDTDTDRPWNINTITLSASIPGQIAISIDGAASRSMVLGSESAIETTVDNASGSETYQWYKTTSSDTDCESGVAISGAESSSFTPDEGEEGTYYYYCVVTDGPNTAKTDLATVVVAAPLTGWVVFDGLVDTEKRSSPVVNDEVSLVYETSSVSIVDVSGKTNATGRPYNKGMQISSSTSGYLKFTIPTGYTATFQWAFSGTGNRTIMLASAKINSTSADGYIATLTTGVTSANLVAGEYTTPLAAGDYYICEGGNGNWQIDALAFNLVALQNHTVTINPNGGAYASTPEGWTLSEGVYTKSVAAGSFNVPDGLTKTDYDLDGWKDNHDNAISLPITLDKDTTLVAQWVEHTLSSDATLSDLTIDGVTVEDFAAATTVYDVELPFGTSVVPTVAGVANSAYAKSVVVTQASSVNGTASVVVTAEDNSTKTYTINFTVAESKVIDLVWKTGQSACAVAGSQTTAIKSDDAKVSTYIKQITFDNVEGSGDNAAEGSSLNTGKKEGNTIIIQTQSGYLFTAMSFYGKIESDDAKCFISIDGGSEWTDLTSTSSSDATYCDVISNASTNDIRIKSNGVKGVWIRNMQLTIKVGNKTPSALDNTDASVKAVKRLENGMLVIEKNGKTYNAFGQTIR